ncbi:MAG TPA: bifunctional 23S rRNA (guanine(2069)-N(7))-methyltransferase RlmK/23S rRNA (guanine(2445)-N(2))-methyltransferase RlmL [Nevskiaceae bacterium]
MTDHPLFISCPRGVEPLLAREAAELGATDIHPHAGGVSASANVEAMYRICLWSRLASRVLLPLTRVEAAGADDIYAAARALRWPELFAPQRRFAVQVAGRHPAIANGHFAALRVKDAVVDGFRAAGLERPTVDTRDPDIRLHLHLGRECVLSLDLAGESLHRRGYRVAPTAAPLKENLACAILQRCEWPPADADTAILLDPMCGSGTLVIEGALMQLGIAPGLRRRKWGFTAWRGHDPALWTQVLADARHRADAALAGTLEGRSFVGMDHDPRAVEAARSNAARAGLGGFVRFIEHDALDCRPESAPGLLVCNLPYGERLGGEAELIRLYSLFGANLRTHFGGWRCGIFTSRIDISPRLGLRAARIHSLYNGAIDCRLLQFTVAAQTEAQDWAPELANRLRKNLRHLGRWAQREGVSCYRLYDADLPEYAVAVDLYRTIEDGVHAHVQEYAAPRTVDPVRAEKRLRGALATLLQTLELPPDHLHYKLRRVQRGTSQYQPNAPAAPRLTIDEHDCRLQVDFNRYLDTGLFLDHRPLRLRIRGRSAGRRILNLFCYTASATAQAIRGGARATLSVDLSRTYLEWARDNLAANGVRATLYARPPTDTGTPARHALVRADARRWLEAACSEPRTPSFDLILLDPPTFSNSKAMEGSFDVQRDHGELIQRATRLLAPGGELYFSTNRRGFRLDPQITQQFAVDDLTRATLAPDFRRGAPAHRCWLIRHRGTASHEPHGDRGEGAARVCVEQDPGPCAF